MDSSQPAFLYSDGGRQASGFKGEARDCVTRAIAIVTGLPYSEVYEALAMGNASQRPKKSKKKPAKSARNGIDTKKPWFKRYMQSLGFEWVPTMRIGQGCSVHLSPDELPSGKLVLSLSKHYTAMIDGVLHDTHDCSREGQRCVYGYWRYQH
ncbi:hypothetical protein [Alteromonas macleodii]|uniref:hypothetical protein n=1 Tax=Alteromonas macleodii TaxID=28108 RepID=UPI00085928F2|nr:hypothetical protein [Alteromonas macleodii]